MAMTSPSSQWSGTPISIISQPVQTEEERLWRYLPLYKLALGGNWKLAKPYFLRDSDAIRAKITAAGDTALHVAAGTGKAIHFVEELLKLGNVSDLRLLNGNGDTALSVAAMVGNTPAAKLFLKRDPQLALIVNNDGHLPIIEAARFGHKKMVLLLLPFIEDGMMEPSGHNGYSLLNLLIMAGFYGKTPAMVFTEAHKDLIKEGEKWMKAAANSCTFVSALIATVGFAAAITVPGGNNQNDGFPIFFKEKAFRVFSISNGMSLISSIASVLIFLSILTSRYAEADFLVSLPRRLFVGLITLFLSITSLTVAFGAAIYLVFGHKDDNIIAPLIALAFLPMWMFGAGHFPLLVDMFPSIMGRSIFRKQSARILH